MSNINRPTRTRDEARDAKIERAMPMVERVARRSIYRRADRDTLVSAGYLALVEAADLHETEGRTGWDFERFAYNRVLWAMKAVVEASGPMRVPKCRHTNLAKVRAAAARLHAAGDPRPDHAALAAEAGITEVQARKAMETDLKPDERGPGRYCTPAPDIDPGGEGHAAMIALVLRAVDSCPEPTRTVFSLLRGLDGEPPMPVSAVARRMHLGGATVRMHHVAACEIVARFVTDAGWSAEEWAKAIAV